jgi:hypothetical protein
LIKNLKIMEKTYLEVATAFEPFETATKIPFP